MLYSQFVNKPNSEIQPLYCSPKRTIEINFFLQFVYCIAEKAHFKCVEFSVVLSLDHLSGANLVCHVRRLSNEQLIMG